jgi:5-methylcytosine-specific restriction endonuclease McrA
MRKHIQPSFKRRESARNCENSIFSWSYARKGRSVLKSKRMRNRGTFIKKAHSQTNMRNLQGVYITTEFKQYWKNIRKRILTRDKHTCVECGKQRKLEIHHINDLGFRVTIPERDDSPINLITLCHTCHEAVDEGLVFESRLKNKAKALDDWLSFEQFIDEKNKAGGK